MSKKQQPERGPDDVKAEEEHKASSRRRFLKQAAAVGGLAVSASYVSLAPPSWPLSIRDPDGERGKPVDRLITLPENGYSVPTPATAAQLGVARGLDVAAAVRAAVDAIGGIRAYISKGDVVVIKPNVAFERAAKLGATTNPEVLSALIKLVREAGASEIRVVDNPIESPESCFVRSGIQKAAIDAGARVYLPHHDAFELLSVPGAKWISRWPFFWSPFRGANKVIGVSPVKDHNLCSASMTTKNWYGLLGGRRNQFHQDIHGIITDLALMMRPTFVVLDGSRVLFRNGPTGGSLSDVRPGNTIAASTDSLAADAFGWDQLLERANEERPAYLGMAQGKDLGNPSWKELRVKEVEV